MTSRGSESLGRPATRDEPVDGQQYDGPYRGHQDGPDVEPSRPAAARKPYDEPPPNTPAIPMRIVTMMPPGSSPGMMSLPRGPGDQADHDPTYYSHPFVLLSSTRAPPDLHPHGRMSGPAGVRAGRGATDSGSSRPGGEGGGWSDRHGQPWVGRGAQSTYGQRLRLCREARILSCACGTFRRKPSRKAGRCALWSGVSLAPLARSASRCAGRRPPPRERGSPRGGPRRRPRGRGPSGQRRDRRWCRSSRS